MTDVNTNPDSTSDVELDDATKALQAEIAEQKDRYPRLAADFDNYRKRLAQEIDRQGDAVFRPAKPGLRRLFFNDEAIRTLRRVEHLRINCGVNLAGIKIILDLMNQVERLQSEVRFLRQ